VGKLFLLTSGLIIFSLPGPAQNLFPRQPLAPAQGWRVYGTSLLFDGWVKAKVLSHNELFKNDSLLFNFDKATQKLLATDKQFEYKINKKEFQSVTFYNGDLQLIFEHVPAINDKDLFCVLVKTDDKYSLYKYIHTIIKGGRYYDWNSYYILFPFPKVQYLRYNYIDKKLIKKAFALSKDIQKVNAYLTLFDEDAPNEYFLKHLIEYLNQ
jgi:hypothetical protein